MISEFPLSTITEVSMEYPWKTVMIQYLDDELQVSHTEYVTYNIEDDDDVDLK